MVGQLFIHSLQTKEEPLNLEDTKRVDGLFRKELCQAKVDGLYLIIL